MSTVLIASITGGSLFLVVICIAVQVWRYLHGEDISKKGNKVNHEAEPDENAPDGYLDNPLAEFNIDISANPKTNTNTVLLTNEKVLRQVLEDIDSNSEVTTCPVVDVVDVAVGERTPAAKVLPPPLLLNKEVQTPPLDIPDDNSSSQLSQQKENLSEGCTIGTQTPIKSVESTSAHVFVLTLAAAVQFESFHAKYISPHIELSPIRNLNTSLQSIASLTTLTVSDEEGPQTPPLQPSASE